VGNGNQPYQGSSYQERTFSIGSEEEQSLHDACGIDSSIFSGCIDPAAFVGIGIQEAVRNDIPIVGALNTRQELALLRPVRYAEPLTVCGGIATAERTDRGEVIVIEVSLLDASGATVLKSTEHMLRRSAADEPGSSAPAARRPSEEPAAPTTTKEIGQAQFTPESVRASSGKSVNPVHTDPAAARKAGFRVPIAGGAQSVRYLTAEIWRQFSPISCQLDIRFKRPIFWDDRCQILVDERDGVWRTISLAREGKAALEIRIESLHSGPQRSPV